MDHPRRIFRANPPSWWWRIEPGADFVRGRLLHPADDNLQVISGNGIIPLQLERTLEPGLGRGIVARLDIMQPNIGGHEVAVGIQMGRAIKVEPRPGGSPKPVQGTTPKHQKKPPPPGPSRVVLRRHPPPL